MAQTQKAQDREQKQTQENRTEDMTRREGGRDEGGLARRGEFSPVSPFAFMRRFSEEMDRLFGDFGFGGAQTITPGLRSERFDWSPQTEVFKRGNELVVRADLPGMAKEDISVDLEEDQIVIRGERQTETENRADGSFYTERSYGSFYRSIPLPDKIDGEQAEANFRDGVLEITLPLPKETERGKRRLEIGGGDKESGGKKSKSGK
jgi:HSP20 family protein